MPTRVSTALVCLLMACWKLFATADAVIAVPEVPSFGNDATQYPFLINEQSLISMRYQQVYNASAFATIGATNIYLTWLTFRGDENSQGIAGSTTNVQVNLSTTTKAADGLSMVFAENVGPDDTVVYGPTNWIFPAPQPVLRIGFILPVPFVYNPSKGNLLMDVRIYGATNGIGPFQHYLDAERTTGDAVSRAFAVPVDATTATTVDTGGLWTGFYFKPVPSLQIHVECVYGTNRPVVRWPSQPSVFTLQTSTFFGTNAFWQAFTNDIGGIPEIGDRFIYLPIPPPGTSGFYRLIWESGQPPAQSAIQGLSTFKVIEPKTR